MQLTKKQKKIFQNKILTWYTKNKRDLPWRKTRDPYAVLISEVMLQQTQVQRVLPKYDAWLKEFPTIKHLADAKISEVLSLWSGLGYNRRALNLKKAAEKIKKYFDDKFPETEAELLTLPGVGEYTARAVLCFAFNKQVAVVDTNVRKVILTQFPKILDREVRSFAQELLPENKAYEWNQALMDYASTVLKKEKISIPKQSKFIGSHRYYRGQILKKLLEKEKIAIDEIGKFIKKDFTEKENDWLKKLLQELAEEGFILIQKGTVQLAK